MIKKNVHLLLFFSIYLIVSCKSSNKTLTKEEIKAQQIKERNKQITAKNKESRKKVRKFKKKGVNGRKQMIYGM